MTASPQSVSADGGSVTITVATTRDCAWTSSSDASWIRLSAGSGQGEATFTANVEANPQIVSRSGNVSVNGQRAPIVQAARPCTFDIAPTSAAIGGSGGSSHVTVTTITGCSWRATTTASWIQVPASAATGSGAFDFQVAANDGGLRTGVISVADKQVVVTQAAASPSGPITPPAPNCVPTVSPLAIDVSAVASTQSVQLVIGPTCAWTASSQESWTTITSPTAGTGNALIGVAIAANTGASRSTTLTIAGQSIIVRQTALSCTFSLNPTAQNIAAAGGSGRFTVTTPAACSWTASKSVPWIDVVQGSGTGAGDVTFNVQANPASSARTGTITVGGEAFSISQAAAPCSYTLSPTSSNMTVDGGHGRVSVETSTNCAWTAVSGAPWLEVSNQSGTGSGDVNFNVQSNGTTAPRSTTITINGQVFTLNQAGMACTFALSPSSATVASAASNGQFSVMTQAGCAWTAAAGAAWVTVTAPQNGVGNGPGDVTYSVTANPDPAPRTTTVAVGGQSYTISQAAAPAPCTYSLNPPTASYASAGGSGTFTVTTQANCAWTAATVDTWLTITAGKSGSSTGDVSYTVESNATGQARSGTISVGGQTFGISQTP